MKKTVVFDFDGVIHSYTSGWKGISNIPDPPVPGIDKALKEIHDAGYEVVIVSTRCSNVFGLMAINTWLKDYGLYQYVDKILKEKPPAIVYIDDRAICFDGKPDNLLEQIESFKPWYNKYGNSQTDKINKIISNLEVMKAKPIELAYDVILIDSIIEMIKEVQNES